MEYFLGIDIGGTKSHAMVADETGHVLGFGSGGPGNHETVGYSGLRRVLKEITAAALSQAGLKALDLAGAGFGVAGYDWPGEREATLEALAVLGLECPLEAVNDTLIGLLAGASEGWGIAIVAGTGENCWGRDRTGRTGRVTGNGDMMGEYGGAGSIVRHAVHAAARSWTKQGPETLLTAAMLETTGAPTLESLLEGLALETFQLGAEFAPVIVSTAAKGDGVALDILEWASGELASLTEGVIRQLDFEREGFEIVLVGSMLRESRILREAYRRRVLALAPGAQFVLLEAPPVIGGVLLGMEAAGKVTPAAREALVESAKMLPN